MSKVNRKYKSLYRGRRRKSGFLKAVVGIIAAAAVVFLGYSIYDPLVRLFSGRPQAVSSAAPPKAQSSSAKEVSSQSKASSSAAKGKVLAVKGAYLPKSCLTDTAALQNFISSAKSAGVNLAVIDLKAEDGIVNYATNLSQVKGTDAVAQNAPDASAAAKTLSAAGITPAARICAFVDPVAPSVIHGSGVLYGGNHSINWLDPTNKRWLNPYSTLAQGYIEDLSSEAVSLGYKEIFIDSLTFPTVGSPDKQGYYGDNMPSKEQVISDFVAALRQKVGSAGGKLAVMSSGTAAIGQAQENIGQSQSIFALSADFESPNLCPSLFPVTGFTAGSITVPKPDLAPGDTVNAAMQYLKSQSGVKMEDAVPFIQDYTNSSIGDGNFKQYTADDVKAQITALKNAGAGGYILYSPTGQYDFSAIK